MKKFFIFLIAVILGTTIVGDTVHADSEADGANLSAAFGSDGKTPQLSVLDTPQLRATVQAEQLDDTTVRWQLHYEKAVSTAAQQLELSIKQGTSSVLTDQLLDYESAGLKNSSETGFMQQMSFSGKAQVQDLSFDAPLTAVLTVAFRLNEQTADNSVQNVLPADQKPTRITLVPATASTDSETKTSDTADATASSATAVTSDSESAAQTSTSSQASASSETNTQAPKIEYKSAAAGGWDWGNNNYGNNTAGNSENVVAEDNVAKPTGDTIDAYGLKLSASTFCDLQVSVSGAGREPTIYEKTEVNNGAYNGNYDGNRSTMESLVSGLYEKGDGNAAKAVIFDQQASDNGSLGDTKIQLDYPEVGDIVDSQGQLQEVGAYVEISDIHLRNKDWGGNGVAMDFSNNFYSGISLINVRYFTWNVIFYVKDAQGTHLVNFKIDADASGQLTFTSLNPGEFVNTVPDGKDEVAFDKNYVEKKQFADGITAYTASKPGNYTDANIPVSDTKEWEDRLGAATFGRGAAAFTLSGVEQSFIRGTFSNDPNTWTANASGALGLVVPTNPPIYNVKKVSRDDVKGGGKSAPALTAKPSDTLAAFKETTAFQSFADQFVPDAQSIDTQNVNDLYLRNQGESKPFYYYVSQETYSLVSDAIVKPTKIIFTDELPEGVEPTDVTLYNTDQQEITLNQRHIQIDGRKIIMTLDAEEVTKVNFDRGYITVKIKAKLTEAADELTHSKLMENTANFKLEDSEDAVKYDEDTNSVTINEGPTVDVYDLQLRKEDTAGNPLAGAVFKLTGEGLGTDGLQAVSDEKGHILFDGGKLQAGQVYQLKEIQAPIGYALNTDDWKITIDTSSATIMDATANERAQALTVVPSTDGKEPNQISGDYVIKDEKIPLFTLQLKKYDVADETKITTLKTAKFQVTAMRQTSAGLYEADKTQPDISDEQIVIKSDSYIVKDLPFPLTEGSAYLVEELTPPDGYQAAKDGVLLYYDTAKKTWVIAPAEKTGTAWRVADSGILRPKPIDYYVSYNSDYTEMEDSRSYDRDGESFTTLEDVRWDNDGIKEDLEHGALIVNLANKKTPPAILPNTGGHGRALFFISGCLLLCLGLLYFRYRADKEVA